MHAQDIDQYRWESRLMLLLTSETDNNILKDQLSIFNADPEGLAERKLRIIQLSPAQVRYGFDDKKNWEPSKGRLYQQYHSKDQTFEAILIGLDGGTKLRETKPLNLDRLFAIIDGMPMRRAELRNKNN